MPRYYFHLVSPSHPVRDTQGVDLPGLDAAHWHAMHLVYRLRAHAGDMAEDWVVEVGDETGAVPLVVLPWAVPMMRHQTRAKPGASVAASAPPARPVLRASAPGNRGPKP
ncbi:MAG: hypothetical protein WBB50_00085 [Methyloceanibacter sp.]